MDIKTFLIWAAIGGVLGVISAEATLRTINVPDSYHKDIVTMYNKFPERLSPMMKDYKETNKMSYNEYWKLKKEFEKLTRKNAGVIK